MAVVLTVTASNNVSRRNMVLVLGEVSKKEFLEIKAMLKYTGGLLKSINPVFNDYYLV